MAEYSKVLGAQQMSIDVIAKYLFKVLGALQMSINAIAKCVYSLRCVPYPMFTPLQGNFHLEYEQDTSNHIFKIIYISMLNSDRRGCHISNLEECNLLFALDFEENVELFSIYWRK